MTAADVVLVAGPPRAGSSSMVARLRERMPATTFVEAGSQGRGGSPAAVVFVVSAVAPMTESDCALAAQLTGDTDAVVAVLAKIDDHRDWRAVLAACRERLQRYSPRLQPVWVGAAAAPRLGEPSVDDVVETLSGLLGDPDRDKRNTLRASETRLLRAVRALDSASVDAARRAYFEALRQRRDALVRARRLAAAQRPHESRAPIQRARLELLSGARGRCAALRTGLLDSAAEATGSGLAQLPRQVRSRCDEVTAEFDDVVSARLTELAAELGVAVPAVPAPAPAVGIAPDPPVRAARLESRLTAVLGAGFGFGVALVLARFLAGLAPGLTVVGSLVGGVAGLVLSAWVVRVRAVLRERAVLDRWITEATSATRAAVEERVATRLLAAETALTSARLLAGAAADGEAAERIASCDAEMLELSRADARIAAVRARCVPGLQRVMATIQCGLRTAEGPGRSYRPVAGRAEGL